MTWHVLYSMGGIGTDLAQGIAVDQNGNSYITGLFDSPSLFPTGPLPTIPKVGAMNAFVIQLSPSGIPLWARK